VVWKIAVPGVGHASPVVVGNRVLISSADEIAATRTLFCYSLESGAFSWKALIHQGAFVHKHDKNSHATPTPVSDGEHAFVPYLAGDSLWLSAIDLRDGRIAWQPRLGPFVSEWGYASSPVLYRDLVIVVGDNKGAAYGAGEEPTSYIVAVSRKTGAVAWRVPRPLAPSYGTPVVARLAGRDQLLISGAERIVSYDPANGQEIWSCRWSGYRSASAVVCGDDRVYASTNWPREEVVCVRANGTGDVSDSHVAWRLERNASDVSSPLYHDGRLYLITDRGIASCLDGATGSVHWQTRLGPAFCASAVLSGDRIFAPDERGTTHVFQAGPRFERLARNSMQEPFLASPALTGDRILLRSRSFLWCIDGKATAAARTLPGVIGEPTAPRSTGRDVVRATRTLPVRQEDPARAEPPKNQGNRSYTFIVLAALQLFVLLVVGGVLLLVRRRRDTPMELDESDLLEPLEEQPKPSAVVFACTGCRRKLRAPPEVAGKRIRCPKCNIVVAVPSIVAAT
jgi:outer membrane protein assembly factor BamB